MMSTRKFRTGSRAASIGGALNPNHGVQGYFGMLLLYLAKHSDMIDPMNDYKRQPGIQPDADPLL